MKLTAFILLCACLHVSAGVVGQAVTIRVRNAPMKEVFRAIQQQTGLDVLVDEGMLQKIGNVSLDVKDMPVADVLNRCLKNVPLDYVIADGRIVIKPRPVGALSPADRSGYSVAPFVTIDVHGRVVNEKGEPVPGATVKARGGQMEKGKGEKLVMASTDDRGEFVLQDVEPNALIVISSVGYDAWELRLNGKTELHVLLHTKVSSLDETQVIAYGTTTPRFNVGSVTTVKGNDIAQQPISNPLQALEGRVPGLQVSQSSGMPGASMQIRIRGQNSLAPTSSGAVLFDNPLFIIDGVPFAPQNTNINQHGSLFAVSGLGVVGTQGVSPFNSINPADIESIDVLRDADATAIYGSRGANGVILITTARGKAGKVAFNASVKTGESYVTRAMPMMSTRQYVDMRREAFKNDNITPTAANAPDLMIFDTTRYTDWRKYFIGGNAHMTEAHTSVSGGTANSQFLVGATYHQEGNIYAGDFGDKRAAVDVSFHHNSTDRKFFIDFSANYSYDRNNSTGNTSYLRAFVLPPNTPSLINSDGSLNWSYKGYQLSSLTAGNPLAYMQQVYLLQNYNLISNFLIGYQVLPGLTFRSSFGYNTFNGNEYIGMPLASQNPSRSPVASASFNTNDFLSWIIEPQAEYKRELGKGRLTFLAGATFQKNTNNSTDIEASDYANDLLINSISAAGATYASGSNSLYKYNAIFGRVNYVYENRYILNLTGRRDGSSRFGPGRQFGSFGSVGAGWIFSDAALVKNAVPFLSFGKIRTSYGTTGNDNIGDYQYLSAYAPVQGVSYQGAGYTPQNLYNPGFSWGVTKKWEIGLELGFLKDRIISNATWFLNRSGNQLITYDLPIQTGFTGVTQNAPYLVQNKGLELQVSTVNIRTGSFRWTTVANLTIPRNKLVSFPGLATSPYAYKYVLGKSLSVQRRYISLGVNDTTGLFQFRDVDHNGAVNQLDWVPIGDLDPRFYGGLGNTFTYRGFQLDVFMQFTRQTGLNYFRQVYSGYVVGAPINLPATFAQRWQKAGDKAPIERLTTKYGTAYSAGSNFSLSNGAYSDASFIRVKTIALSYDLPTDLVKKMRMRGCRLYANAQNLFTITGYKGNDPENQNFFALPPLKTVLLGLQLTF